MCIVVVVVAIAIVVNMFRRRRRFAWWDPFCYSYQLTFINIGYWDWILGLAD